MKQLKCSVVRIWSSLHNATRRETPIRLTNVECVTKAGELLRVTYKDTGGKHKEFYFPENSVYEITYEEVK